MKEKIKDMTNSICISVKHYGISTWCHHRAYSVVEFILHPP